MQPFDTVIHVSMILVQDALQRLQLVCSMSKYQPTGTGTIGSEQQLLDWLSSGQLRVDFVAQKTL